MAATRRIVRTRWRDPEKREAILNLECSHNIHTTRITLESMKVPAGYFICTHCPDEPAPVQQTTPRIRRPLVTHDGQGRPWVWHSCGCFSINGQLIIAQAHCTRAHQGDPA